MGGSPLLETDPTGLLPPWMSVQYLPTEVRNMMVNIAPYSGPATPYLYSQVAAQFETTMFVNWAATVAMDTAHLAAAGYVGWVAGSAYNDWIVQTFGQNAGGALYDMLHSKVAIGSNSSKLICQ